MTTLKIGKRNYEIIETHDTALRYPNIRKYGVVKIHTAKCGKTYYTIDERESGKLDKPIKAFSA